MVKIVLLKCLIVTITHLVAIISWLIHSRRYLGCPRLVKLFPSDDICWNITEIFIILRIDLVIILEIYIDSILNMVIVGFLNTFYAIILKKDIGSILNTAIVVFLNADIVKILKQPLSASLTVIVVFLKSPLAVQLPRTLSASLTLALSACL